MGVAERSVGKARPTLVRRFTPADRLVHWVIAGTFFALLLSGLGLWLPPSANPVIDHRDAVRTVHLDAAVIFLVVFIPSLGKGGPLNALWHEVEMFTREDWAWLQRVAVPRRWRRRPLPPQGRFNAGQKLNTVLTGAALVGFVVTGAVMWMGEHLPPSLAASADRWHLWLMFLVAPLVFGHIAVALLFPSTRPAMRGMLFGVVRLDFARRRHARWADAIAPLTASRSQSEDDPA
ncbi:MAG TPA: cytochrome b/b6 domain-containing protein [Candidatus Dormibacteraeota bacterium]|nr:cytochrome b/b6 domain-containing protein [Candidatus Dormibacteraeota bacterium]